AFEAPQGRGVYRVEVYLSTSPGQPAIPWIVSNPIYEKPADWGKPYVMPQPPSTDSWNIQGGPWHVEHDSRSSGGLVQVNARASKGPVAFSYALGAGARAGQY